MKLISNESMTIKDKTFRLTLRIIEVVLKVLKNKGIQNYNSYLSEKMGTPRPNISRMLNCDGNFTIKTLLKLLDATDLEMEVKFYNRDTLKPIDHVSVATVKIPELPKFDYWKNEVINVRYGNSRINEPGLFIEEYEKMSVNQFHLIGKRMIYEFQKIGGKA